MGARITGVSTPIGGLSWEYTDSEKHPIPLSVVPDQKIKVFISSICGDNGKYDRVRAELKKVIEDTKLADVYLFESKDASTLPSGAHYTFALDDSDICIFLIDNADGINPGVQVEIDTVKRCNIKALYYFCDETSTEKTALEQSLMGARFAKSRTVHKFDCLSQEGALALINDIISIYHYYCQGKVILKLKEDNDSFQSVDLAGTENWQIPTMPKSVLKNVNKCKDYILKMILGHSFGHFPDEAEKTNQIDEWGVQFLPVLFEQKSIKQFNTGLFLDTLKELQVDEYHQIVRIRWEAIQAYFLGDVAKCVEYLETALKFAKERKQPAWVIKDLLIDLRNQHYTLDTINNRFTESSAQRELSDSSEELYYPILDRLHESLHEKYVEGLYKKKIESPYTVTFGNNLDQYGELLASSLIVPMYNGSLTHVLLFRRKIRDFLFYLSCKYSDWNFRRDILKIAIFEGKEKEIKGIQDTYPEVLNNMRADDAAAIMEFCNNHPVKYERLISQLLAFGAVGYYLSDKVFSKYEGLLIKEINEWLNSEDPVVTVGHSIFICLTDVSYRLSQDTLAQICCSFVEHNYRRWYMDMFKLIEDRIDLRKMSQQSAQRLIQHIIDIIENKDDCHQIKNTPTFLCILRMQDRELTEKLDLKIAEYLPDFYSDNYKLETTQDKEENLSDFIQSYVQQIQKKNDTQGKNGNFFEYGTRYIATIRALLLGKHFECDNAIMDSVVTTVADTLLKSKEGIGTKLDAVNLLICIVIKYPEVFNRNQKTFELLVSQQEDVETADNSIISSNIDSISLKIGLQLLFTAMGFDAYQNILELMPYIKNDTATTISVANLIVKYLEVNDDITLPTRIEDIVLQNVLQWLHSDYVVIRWNATRILFSLLRNPDNKSIVNHQLLTLVDSDCVYIKNLIMRQIYKVEGIAETTKNYIISKCENDANFVVRIVCEEERQNHKQEQ